MSQVTWTRGVPHQKFVCPFVGLLALYYQLGKHKSTSVVLLGQGRITIHVVDLFAHHLNKLISHVIQPNLNHALASRPVKPISSAIGSTRIDDQSLT
ncbi:hypothetical protein H5410_004077 [Solanum commersonii]|uniref:Uncharacterized protein n=1 Tax=Solanum commersonii TaxID=4109 RepID=A0A9J6B6Q9_SOLCO|nr:hypothetical protein H5410_004077 [Solanum commersonii]